METTTEDQTAPHNLAGISASSTVPQAVIEFERQCKILFAGFAIIGAIVTAAVFIPRALSKEYRYRDCNNGDVDESLLKRIGDGTCDRFSSWGGFYLNTKECGYDGGDCTKFNTLYKDCVPRRHPSELRFFGRENGDCNPDYNNETCGYDAGNCIEFNELYPNCTVPDPSWLFDNNCYRWKPYNTEECGWDGGACLISSLPNCTGIDPQFYDDGYCQGMFFSEECNYGAGDCQWVLENYPNCHVDHYIYLNSSECKNYDNYNTEECGWQNGACIEFNKQYPKCEASTPGYEFNNSRCYNDPSYNNEECGYDGGDCIEFNKLYPKCTALYAHSLNDGTCVNSDPYNTEECGWDGGDCLEFNAKYPDCEYMPSSKVGDGICDSSASTPECNFDGGDCCDPSKMGDGYCDEENDTYECYFDGGDCN